MATDYDKEIGALRDDLTQLREDIATLVGKASEDVSGSARESAEQLRESANQAAGRAAEELRAHPFAAAAAAFGVGFLLGALIERR